MRRNTVLGFAAGAVVGGVIALLSAPRSGVETRRRVRERTGELTDQARGKLADTADAVRERAVATKDTVREHAVATTDSVRHGVESSLGVVKRNAAALSDAASEAYRVYREQVEVASVNDRAD